MRSYWGIGSIYSPGTARRYPARALRSAEVFGRMTQQVGFLSVGGNTVREITKKLRMPAREWSAAKSEFAVVFGDRLEVNH